MNRRYLSEKEYSLLSSIGIAFEYEPDAQLCPEKVILRILNRDTFIGEKIYTLLLAFFDEFHDLVRVDYFCKESSNISDIGKATLYGLSRYCVENLSDQRFLKIPCYVLTIDRAMELNVGQQRSSHDKHLIQAGIFCRDLKSQGSKKLMSREWVLKNNIWLRNRMLFGVGVRADSFSAMKLNRQKTYYSLSKIVSSSISAARKNYTDFLQLEEIGLI